MEIVENANNELLQDQERYLKYILQNVQEIIKDYNITYNDVKDNRKTYPAFTTRQFIFILTALNKRVYAANTMLLRDDIYKSRYNIFKVELCYSVFKSFCMFFNMGFNVNMFVVYSGIEKALMIQWLNTGKTRLYANILQESHDFDDIEMLNSRNPLLRLHYRNNEKIDHVEAGTMEALPDLQAAKMSLSDAQDNIVLIPDTIISPEGITGKSGK